MSDDPIIEPLRRLADALAFTNGIVVERNDEFYMRMCILIAESCAMKGDRPFGNVIINSEGLIIGAGGGSESPVDPTCHSEIMAFVSACETRQGLLHGCTIYSTHEPCLMCTGAILHAKLSRVVWGSFRQDLPTLFRPLRVGLARWGDTTHPPDITGGILRQECIDLFDGELLQALAREASPK